MEGARTAVNVCMGVKSRESVLILADTDKMEIGEALFNAAHEVTSKVILVVMPPASGDGEEPILMVRELMKNANVILAPTTFSITHTRARRQASRAGARIATMPGITNEMMSRGGITADFKEIEKRIKEIAPKIKNKSKARVISSQGTDITFSIEGRKWILEDTGICNKKGTYTNLPAGEIFIAPVEGTVNGTIVVDGAFMEKLKNPIVETVEKGKVVEFMGKGSEKVESILINAADRLKQPQNAYKVGKFGIGMNPKSRIIGDILEDEKTLGTIHFGFGGNDTFGGTIRSPVHMEGIVMKPTVMLDDLEIIKDGKFQI